MTRPAAYLGLGLLVALSLAACGRKGEPLTPEPRSVEAEAEAEAEAALDAVEQETHITPSE